MITWLVHFNTKNEDKIPGLLKQIQENLNQFRRKSLDNVLITEIQREIYHKDGNWRVRFTTPKISPLWDFQITNTLRLAQTLAYDWKIMGDCDGVLEGIASERFRLSGILWIHWQIAKDSNVQK